jgi:hypothetical protein
MGRDGMVGWLVVVVGVGGAGGGPRAQRIGSRAAME